MAHDDDDPPELRGYVPSDDKPLRHPLTMRIMRVVIVLGIIGFVAPGLYATVTLQHRQAVASCAALVAECAEAQDAFWALHHVLLARQDALTVPDLLNYAAQIGLEVATLMEDMVDDRHADRIVDNIRSAVDSGARRAPAIFIEGTRYEGELDALEGALRAALAG